MKRICLSIAVLFAAVSAANASFHTFTLNEVWQTEPDSPLTAISVVDSSFELPWPPTNIDSSPRAYYDPVEPMAFSVDAIVLPLIATFVDNGGVSFVYSAGVGTFPRLDVVQPGLGTDPFAPYPDFTTPRPPPGVWKWWLTADQVTADTPQARGGMDMTVAAVPEPSCLGLGRLPWAWSVWDAASVVGSGRLLKSSVCRSSTYHRMCNAGVSSPAFFIGIDLTRQGRVFRQTRTTKPGKGLDCESPF